MTFVADWCLVEVVILMAIIAIQIFMSQLQFESRRCMIERSQLKILVTIGTGLVQFFDRCIGVMALGTFPGSMEGFQRKCGHVMTESWCRSILVAFLTT